MSAVTIRTVAAADRSGESTPVDVSAFSTLRLDLQASANMGLDPTLRVEVQHGPTENGPWTVLERKQFFASRVPPDENAWPSRPTRIVLSGFDRYVRLQWWGGKSGEARSAYSAGNPNAPVAAELTDIGLVLGLAGDGQPDAE